MPLNVRRLFASLSLVVFSFIILNAQVAPTSGEVMRGRVSKAKAFIAVKNFNAAIFELENIRRETSDQTVHGVTNVLLMNCYLEQGDYKRAQDFLAVLFNDIKSNKPNAASNYYAAAGQIIKGARNQSERYKALGLMVSDRNLTPEAVTDLEKMRETLEKVIEQSKTLGKEAKHSSNAFALLEETTGARSLLARDDFDAKRWKDEVADSREMLSASRSTVLNAVNDGVTVPTATPTVPSSTVASNNPTGNLPVSNTNQAILNQTPTNQTPVNPVNANPTNSEASLTFQPVKDTKTNADLTAKTDKPAVNVPVQQTPKQEEEVKKTTEPVRTVPDSSSTANSNVQPRRERLVGKSEENKQPETKSTENVADTETTVDPGAPLKVGSLLEFAVQKSNPVYPPTARTLRQTGIVRVEVVVDEEGKVTEVQNLSGPALLQTAARDAVRKWKFKPFTRDGQPVKATGYLSFNFNL